MPFKSYADTVSYLYSRLPMFTRIGSSAYKPDLNNTIQLCKHLGNPQDQFKNIHVGGTNGKGSTSHMLAAILQTAGYKTGLYTSPHLLDFRERIRIDGKKISEKEVIDFTTQVEPYIEKIEPSFFEVTVAMAFNHFACNKVDIAVIEVGLGGRLDSTNIITPILSIITNIGYDHMNILGNKLPEIATEKAGIIKHGVPVIIGQEQPEVKSVFIQRAKDMQSKISFADKEWSISEDSKTKKQGILELTVQEHKSGSSQILHLDLTGSYQLKNLATVLSAVEQLKEKGYIITDEHLHIALKNVQQLTGLMGRWQIISKKPLIICDTGHNIDGINEVLKNIHSTPYKQLHMVIGMVKDKDARKILEILPKNASYYFCQPDLERAKPAVELALEGAAFGLNGGIYDSVQDALHAAKTNASEKDLIFIGGSTFVVAEVL